MSKKPSAVLISQTPYMAYLMNQIVLFSQNKVQTCRLNEHAFTNGTPEGLRAFEEVLQKYAWSQVAEMVHFTFEFHDIPSALLQQLARHRHLSLFVRSARVYRDPQWAADGKFFRPDTLKDPQGVYERTLLRIQEATNELFELGNSVEDVRGLMPAHSLYEMVVCFSLRTLVDVVQKRTCRMLQQELWRPLLQSMRDQLVLKVSPAFEQIFAPPCSKTNVCIHEEEQYRRLKGEVPLPTCEIWNNRTNQE